MAFATKYRIEFTETKGARKGNAYTPIDFRINILEDGFAGSVTDLDGYTNDPVEIRWQEFELYRSGIVPSTMRMKIKATTFNQFSDLVLALDEETHKVEAYWDLGSGMVLFWTGWIRPGTYEEDYRQDNFTPCILEATDGLDRLKDVDFDYAGTEKNLLQIIYDHCISVTGLDDLDIYDNLDIYEQSTNSTTSDSTWDQVDTKLKSFKGKTCHDALSELMESFGCYLIQRDGVWQINHIPKNDGSAYDNRRFNSSLVYQSVASEHRYIDAVTPDFAISGTRLETVRPYKKTVFECNYGRALNHIIDGLFRESSFYQSSWGPDQWLVNRWKESSGSFMEYEARTPHPALKLDGSGSEYAYSPWCEVASEDYDLAVDCAVFITGGSGTAPTISIALEWVNKDDELDYKYYDGASWVTPSTTTLDTTVDVEEDKVFNTISYSSITMPGAGFIRLRLYRITAGGYTIDYALWKDCRLVISSGQSTAKEHFFVGVETSANTFRKGFEKQVTIGDKGSYSHENGGGTRAYLAFEIDFASVVNGEQVSFDILGSTETFEYQSSPGIGTDEFSSAAQLVQKIEAYTGDSYSVWTTNEGVNLEAIRVRANWTEAETGEDYGWNSPSYDTNITSILQNNNSDIGNFGTTDEGRRGAFYVGDQPTGNWDNGTIGGNLVQILAKLVHANYGVVHQRHIGTVIDHSKAFSPIMTIEDTNNNASKVFLFTGGTYRLRSGKINGQFQEVNNTAVTVTVTEWAEVNGEIVEV